MLEEFVPQIIERLGWEKDSDNRKTRTTDSRRILEIYVPRIIEKLGTGGGRPCSAPGTAATQTWFTRGWQNWKRSVFPNLYYDVQWSFNCWHFSSPTKMKFEQNESTCVVIFIAMKICVVKIIASWLILSRVSFVLELEKVPTHQRPALPII